MGDKPAEAATTWGRGTGLPARAVALRAKAMGMVASLPAGLPAVMGVLALTWMAWFPFLLFDTDWMGREVEGSRLKNKESFKKSYMGRERVVSSLLTYTTSDALWPT